MLKDTLPAEVLTAIRVVAAGDALLSPGITRRLIAEFANRPAPGTGRTPIWPASRRASATSCYWWLSACPIPNSPRTCI